MLDLIFIGVIVAFFVVCAAYVRGCARIIDPDATVEDATRAGRVEAQS